MMDSLIDYAIGVEGGGHRDAGRRDAGRRDAIRAWLGKASQTDYASLAPHGDSAAGALRMIMKGIQ